MTDLSDLLPSEARRLAGMVKGSKGEGDRPKPHPLSPEQLAEMKRIAALFGKRTDKAKPGRVA